MGDIEMNFSYTIFLLIIGYIIVALEITIFAQIRGITGFDVDLLPAVVACIGLISPIETMLIVSCIVGIMYDAVSLNPLGVTSFSLIIPGIMIYTVRHLFMPKQWQLQFLCGLFVGIMQPLISFIILLSMRRAPFFSVDVIMVITVSGLICGFVTPAIYKTVSWLDKTFNYKKVNKNSFRQDREIIRGK